MYGLETRMLLKRYLDQGVSKEELPLQFSVTSDAVVVEDRQGFTPWRVGSDDEESGRGQSVQRVGIANHAASDSRTASTRLVPPPRSTCDAWRW